MSFTIASTAPVVLIEFDHQRPGNLRTTGRNQTTRQHIGDPHAQRQRLRQRLAAPALFGAPWPLIFLQLMSLCRINDDVIFALRPTGFLTCNLGALAAGVWRAARR